jgi:hypothetical protein
VEKDVRNSALSQAESSLRPRGAIRLGSAGVSDDERAHGAGVGTALVVPAARAADCARRQTRGGLLSAHFIDDVIDDGAARAGPLGATGLDARQRKAKTGLWLTHGVRARDEFGIDASGRLDVGEPTGLGLHADEQGTLDARRARASPRLVRAMPIAVRYGPSGCITLRESHGDYWPICLFAKPSSCLEISGAGIPRHQIPGFTWTLIAR